MNFFRKKRNLLIILISLLAIFIFKVYLLWQSRGLGWEPDEFMHFLQLRTVFTDFPQQLSLGLDTWAKPLYVYPLGLLVAIFDINSLFPVQVINTILLLATAVLVYLSLRKLGMSFAVSYAGLLFTCFSFILFRSSLTALTEPMFALFLTAAYYLFLHRQYQLSALLVGLSVLDRIEGLLFVAIWLLYIILSGVRGKRLLGAVAGLFLPVALWNFVGFLTTGRLFFLLSNGYTQAGFGAYGYGAPSYYVEGLMRFEFIILILYVIGRPLLIKWPLRKVNLNLVLAVDSFLVFLVVQTILYRFGLFGTAGLMRYFIGILPLAIIGAMYGLELIVSKVPYNRWQKILLLTTLIVLQIGFTLTTYVRGGYFFGQHNRPVLEAELQEAGKWLAANAKADNQVYADRPEVLYYADRDLRHSSISLRPAWNNNQPGIYVWTVDWGQQVWHISREELFEKGVLLTNFQDRVLIFELK